MNMFLKTLLGLSIALYVIGFYNDLFWFGELIVSFALQHIISTILLFAAFAINRQTKTAVVCALFLATQVWQVSTFHTTTITPNGENVRILQYNVFYQNKRLDNVIEWIETNHQSLDIVFLQEVTPEFKQKLKKLRKKFPYMISTKDDRCLVKTLLSKIPIQKHSAKNFKGVARQYMVVDFKTKQNKRFTLFGIHTTSPQSENCWRNRNSELNFIANEVNSHNASHKLIMGDFNTTPYSKYFRNLVESTNMKSTLSGFSGNTWPSNCKLNILMVPIDHMVVSKNIQVLQRKVGPDLGSDHLPVITHIAIS